MIPALIGVISVIIVTGVWTKKYLPSETRVVMSKYVGYTWATSTVLSVILLELYKLL